MTASLSALPAGPAISNFSARNVISASYYFCFTHAKAIFSVIWLPVLLAAILLFVACKIYFTMLALYLRAPDVRIASLTISVTVAALFMWLLLNAIAAARVARLAASQNPVTRAIAWPATSARLYAGLLRYLLVLVAGSAVLISTPAIVSRLLAMAHIEFAMLLGGAAAASFCFVVSVRCGFLIPALAFFEKRRILRRGWQLSRASFWQLALVWTAVTALPLILVQSLGELFVRQVLAATSFDLHAPLHDAASSLATNLPAILAIVGSLTLSSATLLVLSTIASCLAYPSLSVQSS